jgi:hypothetical protein
MAAFPPARPLALVICALLFWSSGVTATIYVVRPDGTGDLPTIQAAIDICQDGDIVELTDGAFTGDGNRDIDFLGKAIAVRPQNGNPDLCVTDCQGSVYERHRGFSLVSGEGAASVISGLTITGGSLGPGDMGGAIFCDGGSPTIVHCVIRDNWASGDASRGGGRRDRLRRGVVAAHRV